MRAKVRVPVALFAVAIGLNVVGLGAARLDVLISDAGPSVSRSNRAWKNRRYFGSYTIFRPRTVPRSSYTAATDSAVTSMWAWV